MALKSRGDFPDWRATKIVERRSGYATATLRGRRRSGRCRPAARCGPAGSMALRSRAGRALLEALSSSSAAAAIPAEVHASAIWRIHPEAENVELEIPN